MEPNKPLLGSADTFAKITKQIVNVEAHGRTRLAMTTSSDLR